eukprot:gene15315-20298_t
MRIRCAGFGSKPRGPASAKGRASTTTPHARRPDARRSRPSSTIRAGSLALNEPTGTISMTTVFVDSNVVIYSMDRLNPEKRSDAQAWLRRLGPSDLIVMSPQVLNEAYAVLTLKHRLDPVSDGVRAMLARFERWVTARLDFETALAAWTLQDRYGVRIWDALLLASANAAGCTHFLSEDLGGHRTDARGHGGGAARHRLGIDGDGG